MKAIKRIGMILLVVAMVLSMGACGKEKEPTIEAKVDVITEHVDVEDSTVAAVAEHVAEQNEEIDPEANMILTVCPNLSKDAAEMCVDLLHKVGSESISVVSSFGENTLEIKDSASTANHYHVVFEDDTVKMIQYGDDQGPILYPEAEGNVSAVEEDAVEGSASIADELPSGTGVIN